jgi:hypothetical protein
MTFFRDRRSTRKRNKIKSSLSQVVCKGILGRVVVRLFSFVHVDVVRRLRLLSESHHTYPGPGPYYTEYCAYVRTCSLSSTLESRQTEQTATGRRSSAAAALHCTLVLPRTGHSSERINGGN